MPTAFPVQLVSPEAILFEGEAEMVVARAVSGSIAFLYEPLHAIVNHGLLQTPTCRLCHVARRATTVPCAKVGKCWAFSMQYRRHGEFSPAGTGIPTNPRNRTLLLHTGSTG